MSPVVLGGFLFVCFLLIVLNWKWTVEILFENLKCYLKLEVILLSSLWTVLLRNNRQQEEKIAGAIFWKRKKEYLNWFKMQRKLHAELMWYKT